MTSSRLSLIHIFQDMREKLSTKPMKGHFEKAGVSVKRFVREFKLDDAENYELGQKITVDVFEAGDKVDATAISKGKGFQGAIKRHGQHTGPKTHGSKYHRHAGSNGMASDPSKVMKGKKMPGQMGHVQILSLIHILEYYLRQILIRLRES